MAKGDYRTEDYAKSQIKLAIKILHDDYEYEYDEIMTKITGWLAEVLGNAQE